MKPYLLIVICISLVLSGCKTLNSYSRHTPQVGEYIAYLNELQNMDSRQLEKAHDEATTRYSADPEPETRLYLALVLAQTDYEQSDLQSARSHLLAVIHSNAALPEKLIQFARIELEYVNQVLQLKQLVQAYTRDTTDLQQELARQEEKLARLESEKHELQQKLKEANAKLRALADIEEDLSETTEANP